MTLLIKILNSDMLRLFWVLYKTALLPLQLLFVKVSVHFLNQELINMCSVLGSFQGREAWRRRWESKFKPVFLYKNQHELISHFILRVKCLLYKGNKCKSLLNLGSFFTPSLPNLKGWIIWNMISHSFFKRKTKNVNCGLFIAYVRAIHEYFI